MIARALVLAVAVLAGHPRIVDGDTLAFGPQRVRLWGMDAPEVGRPFAAAATARLADLARPGLACRPRGRDRYGRTVAVCQARGVDVGRELVREGLAVDWPRYSHGAYAFDQARARKAGVGVWSDPADAPVHR